MFSGLPGDSSSGKGKKNLRLGPTVWRAEEEEEEEVVCGRGLQVQKLGSLRSSRKAPQPAF